MLGVSMSIAVGQATPDDASALQALNRAFNADDTDLAWIICQLRNKGTQEHVFVACRDGLVIGFCCLSITSSFCRHAVRAEVTELFVHPEHRRSGAARKLLAAAERLAAESDIGEFFVLTNKNNSAGRSLYKSRGYVEGNDLLYRKKDWPNQITGANARKRASLSSDRSPAG